MKNQIFAITTLCFLAFADGNAATTITFQPAALPGGSRLISQWVEQNFQFVTSQGLVSNDISDGLYPFNGTAYLQVLTSQPPLTISTLNSAPFNLASIDLAEYSTVFAVPATITFIGTKVVGGTVTATFVTDGVIDGNGSAADFQTFAFPSSFSNLSSVTTNTATFSFDNLKATVVPEPSCIAFLLFGVLFLYAQKRLTMRCS